MLATPAVMGALILHAACTSDADTAAACGDLPAGRERDMCWLDEIQAVDAAEVDQVSTLVAQVEDPVVRDAAVLGWLDVHRDRVSPRQGEALCRLLHATRAQSCLRRLQAAHLQR